ncbi:MAG: CocE/NonD family hydrolase [Paracoccaceae bacterium]
MSQVTAMPVVERLETVWIPMSDGVRLAARMWIPANAEKRPVPAILEYIPYRRRDGARERDDVTHGQMAAHGYGCVRLDIRGTGDSEGLIHGEYLQQEQDDAVEAIAWLAKQLWCNGHVGMMGISWGGFNALQVAARRPAALKAIVTLCSTDDRYADDMHYMGGVLMTGNLEWGSTFFSIMGLPPDPSVFGEKWRDAWMERLHSAHPPFAEWMDHQRRDAFWKHGSVCDDIGAIECAVLAVGGWADGYSNAVFRLLRDLKAPCRGIVGPWGHKYPQLGVPGPAIDFVTEMLRWWDFWLKGRDTGVMTDPALRSYMRDWVKPASHHDFQPGRWISDESWPSSNIRISRWFLNKGGLAKTAGEQAIVTLSSPLTIGAGGGEWCPYSLGGLGPEMPTDQREDDSLSLVFDSKPLEETFEILGAPTLTLHLASDRPVAQIIVRLNDVSPQGDVGSVTYGVLNLTHRDGHETPQALVPEQTYAVTMKLNDAAYRFQAGHKLRIALSTSYWPMIWPSPEQVRLTLQTAVSTVSLPVRVASETERPVLFAAPENTAERPRKITRTGQVRRVVSRNVGSNEQCIEVLRDEGNSIIEEIGTEIGYHKVLRYRIQRDDPSSARADADYNITYRNDAGWDVRLLTHSAVTCTQQDYVVEADLQAFEGKRRIFSKSWTRRIPRDLA